MNRLLHVKNMIPIYCRLDLAQMSVILDFSEHQNREPAPIQSKIYINLLVDLG